MNIAYFSDGCVKPINALHCLLKLPARQDTLDNEDSFFTAAFTISCGIGCNFELNHCDEEH